MSRSTVESGLRALVGLSAVAAFVAVVGLSVVAAERIDRAATDSPLLTVAVAGGALGAMGLVVAHRRGWFARVGTPFGRGDSLEPTRQVDPTKRHTPGDSATHRTSASPPGIHSMEPPSGTSHGTAIEESGVTATEGSDETATERTQDTTPETPPDVDSTRPANRLTRAEARAILDVGLTADESEIKRTYRERVAEVHPDRGGDEASFKRLTAAYRRLLRED